jgi:hypothetical protein
MTKPIPLPLLNYLQFHSLEKSEELLKWIETAKKFTSSILTNSQIAQVHKQLNQIKASLNPTLQEYGKIELIQKELIELVSLPNAIKTALHFKDSPENLFKYLENLPQDVRFSTLESIWNDLEDGTKKLTLIWIFSRFNKSPFAFLHHFKNLLTDKTESLGAWFLKKCLPYSYLYIQSTEQFLLPETIPFDDAPLRYFQLLSYIDKLIETNHHDEYLIHLVISLNKSLHINWKELKTHLNKFICYISNQPLYLAKLENLSDFLDALYRTEKKLNLGSSNCFEKLRAMILDWFHLEIVSQLTDQYLQSSVFTFLGFIKKGSLVGEKREHTFWIDLPTDIMVDILRKTYKSTLSINGVYSEITFRLLQNRTLFQSTAFNKFFREEMLSIIDRTLALDSIEKIIFNQLHQEQSTKQLCLSNWDNFKSQDYEQVLKFFQTTHFSEAQILRIFLFVRLPFKTAAYMLKRMLVNQENVTNFLNEFSLPKQLQVIDWLYCKTEINQEWELIIKNHLNQSINRVQLSFYSFKSAAFFSLFSTIATQCIHSSKTLSRKNYICTLSNYLNFLYTSGTKHAIFESHAHALVKEFIEIYKSSPNYYRRIAKLLFTGYLTLLGQDIVLNPERKKHLFLLELPQDLISSILGE